ncbi:hypothetical protein [Aestuariispira insulae]|uniref:Tetratricopeptide repeat protein n=1 Tax=Aestuariispira insulae TaxID=1461337 RepID=A0A3D9HKD2_9PROT|nr:hypothetical protein [Aestuariispira insulae]RED49972.1 hypothetical protein DFP90_105345 [Aestuariispira insulae]
MLGACLFIAPLALPPLSAPALAQNAEIDPLTQSVMQDAMLQLRFAALQLETDDEVGQALEGLVRAMLARDEMDKALEEAGRIDDSLWVARAYRSIAVYLHDKGDIEGAKNYLKLASEKVEVAGRLKRASELLRLIAVKQAEYGDLESAIRTTRKIPSVLTRLQAFQDAAAASQTAAMEDDKATKEVAARVLRQAFEQAKNLKGRGLRLVRIFVGIARNQTRADDKAGATLTLEFAKSQAEKIEQPAARNRSFASIASGYTFASDQARAMAMLRLIPEGSERALALSSVARSLGETGDPDAGISLFILAKEQMLLETNPERAFPVYAQILKDETAIGRYADAFNTAGLITDRRIQAKALMGMGLIMMRQKKYDEAKVLLNYIPFISMRAPIFAEIARHVGEKGKRVEASELLLQALEPTGFEPVPELLPQALKSVLSIQLRFGTPESDSVVFQRARELSRAIPDNLSRVNALTYLATAEASRGLHDDANRTISSAWTIAWLNKKNPAYPLALANIAQSQIAVGDILSAFDTSARLPDPQGEAMEDRAPDGSFRAPKFDALTSVAVAAAKTDETDLALRAARQIDHPPAKAAALAAVAVASAAPDRDLREIVGIGPTDVHSYNVLTISRPAATLQEDEEIVVDEGVIEDVMDVPPNSG